MKARLHSPNPKSVILTRGLIQKSLCEKCSNAELFLVRISLYLGWIRTRNNSVFRHFSCSECLLKLQNNLAFSIIHHLQADPCMKQKISLHIIPVYIIVSWITDQKWDCIDDPQPVILKTSPKYTCEYVY